MDPLVLTPAQFACLPARTRRSAPRVVGYTWREGEGASATVYRWTPGAFGVLVPQVRRVVLVPAGAVVRRVDAGWEGWRQDAPHRKVLGTCPGDVAQALQAV